MSLPPIVLLLSGAVSASSKAFCPGSHCACSSGLPRVPSPLPSIPLSLLPSQLRPCWLRAGCLLPLQLQSRGCPAWRGASPAALLASPQPPAGLRAVGRSWSRSCGTTQQPSPSPLWAATALMESERTRCATRTHPEVLTCTKHHKSSSHISQPPGPMPAEIWNCLYRMYSHLGHCFQNFFWQRRVEGEGAVFERRNNRSFEGVSFGREGLLL